MLRTSANSGCGCWGETSMPHYPPFSDEASYMEASQHAVVRYAGRQTSNRDAKILVTKYLQCDIESNANTLDINKRKLSINEYQL